jgi:hypothetical protein
MSNFLKNIVDDPFCPKGVFYILEREKLAFLSYGSTSHIDSNTNGTEPGRSDPLAEQEIGTQPHQLLIEDFFSIEPG